MRFTTLACVMLLGIATPGSAGGSIDVFANYEDIEFFRQKPPPYLPRTETMYDYLQLYYTDFRAYRTPEFQVTNTTPIGNQSAVGFNLSEIAWGVPTTFQPKSASLGCVSILKPLPTLAINCTVRVHAYSGPDGDVEYPTPGDCTYPGTGNLTKCDFPPEWKLVTKLAFEVREYTASFVLPDETIPVEMEGDYIQFLFDDFLATYQCPQGGDAETGLCAESVDFRENELRK